MVGGLGHGRGGATRPRGWRLIRSPRALQGSELEASYRALLSAEELAGVASGASQAVRAERLLSKALARATLARYTGLPPAALPLRRGAQGKPWLELGGASALHFSVAHCAGALLLALSADGPLGVDVEPLSRGAEAGGGARQARLARRFFTQAEAEALAQLPDGEPRRARFLQLWTLKEAFVKASGAGIAGQPLSSFGFALQGGLVALQPPAPAHFSLLALGEAHVAALCTPARARLRCWRARPLAGEEQASPLQLASSAEEPHLSF